MKIFKLFLKHVINSPVTIILNFILLLVILLPIYSVYQDLVQAEYEPKTYKIGIINHDSENLVTQHFLSYLDNEAELIQLDVNNPQEEADKLYTGEIDYALTIPADYGDSLLNTEEGLPLEKNYSQNLEGVTVVDNLLYNYAMNFKLAKTSLGLNYQSQDLEIMLNRLSDNLSNTVEIKKSEVSINVDTLFYGQMFITYAAYIIIQILIMLYTLPMMEGRKAAIATREAMSSISDQEKLKQYFLASSFVGIVLWLIIMGIAAFLLGFENMTNALGLRLTLASVACLIGIQGMAFFLAMIITNKNTLTFVQTIVSLLITFGSGIFVPRIFISEIFQIIVSIASPIWLVKTSELLINNDYLSGEVMAQYWQYLGIMVLIGVAYYALSFFFFRYRTLHHSY